MTISTSNMRRHLKAFEFTKLFVVELGWNNYHQRISPIQFDGSDLTYSFVPIAEKGGMIVVQCESSDRNIPPSGVRRKINKHISGLVHENIIIFVDGDRATSLWMWVKREDGKSRVRDYTYRREQSGDALLQRLAGIIISIEELDADGHISIATVASRVQQAFDVERVTRRFYDIYKAEHATFLEFLQGIEDADDRAWYTSVMLDRLMFLYFIQKKGFLNGDYNYLRTKLAESQGHYYRDFLYVLFFYGLGLDEAERGVEVNQLLGDIPYLNGGLFLPHEIEERYGDQIDIPDAAFERLFDFFEQYQWHLDDRPLRAGNEINPDVLGYIFEKYVNQKQMGAYYTKEDITGYICTYTVLPFLFEKVGLDVRAVMTDVEPYIYEAVSAEEYLPTETEREYKARRNRYQSILDDFAAGKIATINDLITYNLNIRALAEDWLLALDDPLTLRRFYFECLTKLTVLDPTCGSGAFLFAAMNILETLYELCIDRMQHFAIDKAIAFKYPDFQQELDRIAGHPNRRYFVFKSIIVNNLYGVDIMEEAVEIAKLRLFLKLVAQVEDVASIEPLPDIDFNIRAGNTLVGYATHQEIARRLFATEDLIRQVAEADRAMANFRALQVRLGIRPSELQQAKADIQTRLAAIRDELDTALMQDYGRSNLAKFRRTHQPFHWYMEFNHVMANGGFDVIVGNPPYVEYSKVRGEYRVLQYRTERSGNLYAFIAERSLRMTRYQGRTGLIVPISAFGTTRTETLQSTYRSLCSHLWIASFGIRPSKLFEGAEQRLSICISQGAETTLSRVYATKYHRWYSEEREYLLYAMTYQEITQIADKVGYAKISTPAELSILAKLPEKRLAQYFRENAPHYLYWHRIPGYFIKAVDFVPYFYSDRDGKKKSEDYKLFGVDDEGKRGIVVAILSSTVFYWFWFSIGDGYHCGKHEVLDFPIDLDTMTPTVRTRLRDLSVTLMEDLRKNSQRRVRNQKTTNIEYEEFYPSSSKYVIDEIDRVLAKHYGFTDEELDFIINYDIKYRMGREDDEEEE